MSYTPHLVVAQVAAGLAVGSTLGLSACGGTTGEPEVSPNVVVPLEASTDATLGDGDTDGAPSDASEDAGLYTGLYDVGILYADRALPVITPAPSAEAGAEGGGFPFPTSCPPYITVNFAGDPVGVASESAHDELPADSTSDGGVTFAADASVCQYPWLGSSAVDECTTSNFTLNLPTYPALPPCNWCPPGSGAVGQGPNPGEDRTTACWALYQCIMKTQCYEGPSSVGSCLCGSELTSQCSTDPHPSGPCAAEEFEALETNDPNRALQYFTVSAMPGTGSATCGSLLNFMFENAALSACFPPEIDP